MSQGLLQELGGAVLSVALSTQPAAIQQIFMTAFGVGTNTGIILPCSRVQESEADHIGLILFPNPAD
jgi:Zn-dependent protease with chaperone function